MIVAHTTRRIVFITVICVFTASPLTADPFATVELMETSVDPGMVMTINSSGYDGSVFAGIYNLALQNATNTFNGSLDGSVEAFCIDVWDFAPGTFQPYDMVSLVEAPDPLAGPMGPTKAAHLAQLLDNYWHGSLDDTTAAALQIAVWEVVDEASANSYNVSGGNFQASGDLDVALLANTMLDSITTGVAFTNYLALSNHETDAATGMGLYQDYVVKTPVPSAVLLGMLGLGAAGVKLRKFT